MRRLPAGQTTRRQGIDDMEDRTGKTAYIRYRGGVAGEQPHDVRMDEPLAVRIGGHRVCKGIERALGQMEVGERAARF